VPLSTLPVSQAGLIAPQHELAPANENTLLAKASEPPKRLDDQATGKLPKSRFASDKFDSSFGSDTVIDSAVENKLETKSKMRKLPGALEDTATKKFEPTHEDHYSSAPSPPQPNMALFIPASIALVGKLWYVGSFFAQIIAQLPWLASEVGQIALCIGIIIYAAKGAK
jgi:hypothetical protein